MLAAEDLRDAAHEIGLVSGLAVQGEDVLDRLFGQFCIGQFLCLKLKGWMKRC